MMIITERMRSTFAFLDTDL